MAEKKDGFFKRMFRFGKKERALEEVEDATSNTALGTHEGGEPVAHAEAAANVIADSEAGADLTADAGITPIKDIPAPTEDAKKKLKA